MLQNQPNLQILYTDTLLADLFQVLDNLHTAASEDQLPALTPLAEGDLVGWLQDLVFTAQETITEIEKNRPVRPETILRLVVLDSNRRSDPAIVR